MRPIKPILAYRPNERKVGMANVLKRERHSHQKIIRLSTDAFAGYAEAVDLLADREGWQQFGLLVEGGPEVLVADVVPSQPVIDRHLDAAIRAFTLGEPRCRIRSRARHRAGRAGLMALPGAVRRGRGQAARGLVGWRDLASRTRASATSLASAATALPVGLSERRDRCLADHPPWSADLAIVLAPTDIGATVDQADARGVRRQWPRGFQRSRPARATPSRNLPALPISSADAGCLSCVFTFFTWRWDRSWNQGRFRS